MGQDVSPHDYPDASDADKLRFARQQYAEAMQAKRLTREDRSVEHQNLSELAAEIERLERKVEEGSRIHTVYTRHARSR